MATPRHANATSSAAPTMVRCRTVTRQVCPFPSQKGGRIAASSVALPRGYPVPRYVVGTMPSVCAAPSSLRTTQPILGGRYVLDRLVGQGTSARVYTATDRSLGRRVAVKLLHDGLAADGPFRRRFESEARHAASLNHPSLLAIYDWAEGEQVYLVTELLEGGSLRALLDSGHRLTPSQAVLIGLQAGSGLVHAHAEGFVHRDIKPANLMFTEKGRLKIADFGISRAVAEASWTEPDGALIGTARYAAPEQALGRGIDGRADVYALGLTLIEAVTGEVPLVGANPLATMVMRQDTDVEVDPSLGALGDALALTGRASVAERPWRPPRPTGPLVPNRGQSDAPPQLLQVSATAPRTRAPPTHSQAPLRFRRR
jgi:serine/threonine protein kinase